jgi:hypothetical protein
MGIEDSNGEVFEGEDTINTASNKQSSEPDGVYPDAVLNIARDSASVFQLKRKWEKKPSMLNLAPDFQRNLVWQPKQKSELIESILMGIPLPLIYVKEDERGVYIIVDGKQRLSTLFEFINNEFALTNLSILKDKNGCWFEDLTPMEQNKIEDCSLTLHVIKAPTSDRVTFDLFDRVNRGGTRLNNQEMRNALYQGHATELINRLAQKPEFIDATENTLQDNNHMKDRYLVLRFVAFYMWQKGITKDVDTNEQLEYKSNLEDFLGKTMRFLNRLDSKNDLFKELESKFTKAMKLALQLIPLGGFRLPSVSGKRRPINMAFFESFSYLLSNLTGDEEQLKDKIKQVYRDLMEETQYIDTLTHSVDSGLQTDERYKIINKYIGKLNLC